MLVSYVLALTEEECTQVFYVVVVFFLYLFFLPSAVSAIKIFWTAVAAHVEHSNVCFVVARHACSGCASLCPHGWPSFIIAIKLGRYNLH